MQSKPHPIGRITLSGGGLDTQDDRKNPQQHTKSRSDQDSKDGYYSACFFTAVHR